MTILTASPEVAQEIEASHAAHLEAETAYIRAMNAIVDWGTITVGDRGFDWNVEVPASKMHEVTQKIVEIEYEIENEHRVRFRTYAMAVPG